MNHEHPSIGVALIVALGLGLGTAIVNLFQAFSLDDQDDRLVAIEERLCILDQDKKDWCKVVPK